MYARSVFFLEYFKIFQVCSGLWLFHNGSLQHGLIKRPSECFNSARNILANVVYDTNTKLTTKPQNGDDDAELANSNWMLLLDGS